VPEEVQQGVDRLHLRLSHGCAPLLGAFIGHDEQAISTACLRSLEEYQPTFDALDHNAHLPDHIAYVLSRLCHHPILNHKARTMRPAVVAAAARAFDARLLDSLKMRLERFDLGGGDPFAEQQVSLPIKYGGLGLRKYSDVISPAAYVASMLQSMPFLKSLIERHQHGFAADDPRRNQLPTTSCFAALAHHYQQHLHTLEQLRTHDRSKGRPARRDELQLPTSVHDTVTVFGKRSDDASVKHHYQRTLSRRQQELVVVELFSAAAADDNKDNKSNENDNDINNNNNNNNNNAALLPNKTRARIASLASRHSMRWASQVPQSPELTLSNPEFRLSVRTVLGLPLSDNLPMLCPCNKGVRPSDPEQHDHPLTCPLHKKRAQNVRHDNLRRAIASVATHAAGLSQQPEMHHSSDPTAPPESQMHQRAYRPDLVLTGGNPPVLHIDVTVVHPAAASHVAGAARRARDTVKKAEQQKEKESKEWAEHVGVRFLAFGIETYGALGPQALRVVDHIARAAAALPSRPAFVDADPATRVRNELLNRVSIELQRGNARVIQEAIRYAHSCHENKAAVKKAAAAAAAAAAAPAPAAARRRRRSSSSAPPAAAHRVVVAALGGASSSAVAAGAPAPARE
jgi:hypothetical protein